MKNQEPRAKQARNSKCEKSNCSSFAVRILNSLILGSFPTKLYSPCMPNFLREFKAFAARGNVIDMAVGIAIGAAFGKIVSSFVDDILMPPLGVVAGKVDFADLYFNLSGGHYSSLAQAKAAGAATLNYGLFVNQVINFLIVSFAIFLMLRQINKLKRGTKQNEAPTLRDCPFCLSAIPVKATRCSACTSQLSAA